MTKEYDWKVLVWFPISKRDGQWKASPVGTPSMRNRRKKELAISSLKWELPFPNAVLSVMDGWLTVCGNYDEGCQMGAVEGDGWPASR